MLNTEANTHANEWGKYECKVKTTFIVGVHSYGNFIWTNKGSNKYLNKRQGIRVKEESA